MTARPKMIIVLLNIFDATVRLLPTIHWIIAIIISYKKER